MSKKILELGLALALVAVMVMPLTALAAQPTTDTITGQFQTGSNTPVVTVTLWDEAGTLEVASITPFTAYTVKVHVTDDDGLVNMNTVTLKVWYDSTYTAPDQTKFDAFTTAGAQTGIIYTWTNGGSFVFTGDAGGSTWAAGASSAPGSLPGDFTFKFTVGKVANQTTASTDRWQVGAQVVDKDPHTVYAYDSEVNTMEAYREIDVALATTLDWGTVPAGMDFTNGSSKKSVGNIKYTSNGIGKTYSKKVSTTSSWGTTAILDPDGETLAANNFSLKAANSDTLPTDPNGYVTVSGVTTGTGTGNTGEGGATDTTNNLWLKLAPTFAGGTFGGTITYTIQ